MYNKQSRADLETQLDSLLADNTSQDISAQDLRSAVGDAIQSFDHLDEGARDLTGASQILLDYCKGNHYSLSGTARTGNIAISVTGILLGGQALIRHNDGTIPTLSLVGSTGGTFVYPNRQATQLSDFYATGGDNYIRLVCVDTTENAEVIQVEMYGPPVTGSGGGGSDNLGNHTATQDLNMAGFDINNAPSLWPLVTTGTSVTLNRLGGRTYGNRSAPLTTFTIDETGKVAEATAIVYLNASTDPLATFTGNIKNQGYEFVANTLMRVELYCESDGTTIGVSSIRDAENVAPSVNSISLSGTHTVGNSLTLTYAYSDLEGDSENVAASGTQYEIRSYPDQTTADGDIGTPSAGTVIASGDTLGAAVLYALTASETDQYLVAWIEPKATSGTLQGAWYRGSTSVQVTAAAGFVPSDLANAVLTYYPPFSTSPGADIQNTNEVEAIGDYKNSQTATAGSASIRPLLATRSGPGNEVLDFLGSGTASRLIVGTNTIHDLSGGDFFMYLLISLDALPTSPRHIIQKDTNQAVNSYALDIRTDGSLRFYGGPGKSTNNINGTVTTLASAVGSNTYAAIKIKIVGTSGEMWVDIGSGYVSQGTGTVSIPANTGLLIIDQLTGIDAKIEDFTLGTTMTAQEETDMDTYIQAKTGI